jgi:N-acetylmuramoyl-L-alanine amidase
LKRLAEDLSKRKRGPTLALLGPVLLGLACSLLVCSVTVAAQAPAAAPPQAPLPPAPPRPVIVLDAAHGGDDSGALLAGNQPEKSFTLALSVRLRSLLAARGFQVITTREADATIDTVRRAEIADRFAALACLSLHASEAGSGVHLFASSVAPAAPTRIPAWKTAQAAYVTRSLALAGVVNAALEHADIPVTLGRTALPGVDSMTCPALAIEIAPDRTPGSKAPTALDDPAYQSRVAEALAAAMLEWKTEPRQP